MQTLQRSVSIILMASLLLAMPLAGAETFFAPQPSAAPTPIPWSFGVSRDILDDSADLLVLANRDNRLDEAYPPEDALHTLTDATVRKTKNEEMLAREVANEALVQLFAAADADGIHLLLHSAHRSHYRQAVQYELRLEKKGHDDGYVLPGGASEHQTGLAFDVINRDLVGKNFP